MKNPYVIALVASVFICAATVIYTEIPRKVRIPAIDLQLTDLFHTHFNTQSLPEGRVTALIYFSPDCEECQEETKNIVARMNELKQINFCYVSSDNLEKVKLFHDYFHLSQYPNITIGRDSAWSFFRYFHPKGTPTIALFNKKRELFALSTGKMSVDSLLHYVHSM